MTEDNKWSVYKHTCIGKGKHTGWVYIGITSQPTHRRWRKDGEGYKKPSQKQSILYNCIKKYGWEKGFTHEILFDNLTFEEACLKEKELIKYFNCMYPNGFNSTIGGEGVCGYKLSEEDIETRRKAKSKTISKPILQISFEGEIIKEWRSHKEASKILNFDSGQIHACLKKKKYCYTASGYFWVYKSDFTEGKFDLNEYKKHIQKPIICQIDENNVIINTYSSLKEIIERNPNFSKSSISGVLNNTPKKSSNGKLYYTKTSGGFAWKYQEV